MIPFNLRFDLSDIDELERSYCSSMPASETEIETKIKPKVQAQGYMDKESFLFVCEWKTPRQRKRYANNSEEFIQEVTASSLDPDTKTEDMRIKVLRTLDGVDWPVASVILHWFHSQPYPLLDYRALESLGVFTKNNSYNFAIWNDYVGFCRKKAKEAGVSMRKFDRALWQYSKDNPTDRSNLTMIT